MNTIEIDRLTKDYGRGRGVFDLTFSVAQGEAFGFLGPNGAGKTTTIRHLMGFSRPQSGSCRIGGLESDPSGLKHPCSDSGISLEMVDGGTMEDFLLTDLTITEPDLEEIFLHYYADPAPTKGDLAL